jgi:hypothetical protein
MSEDNMFVDAYESASSFLSDWWNDEVDSVNQGLGYGKALIDRGRQNLGNMIAGENTTHLYPFIDSSNTPFYELLSIFSSKDSERLNALDLTIQDLDLKEHQLDAIVESGELKGDFQYESEGRVYTIEETYNIIHDAKEMAQVEKQNAMSGYSQEELGMVSDRFQRAARSASPLIVALAGLEPKLIRPMMGLQLGLDALTGVLNFRNPAIENNYNLFRVIEPYIAMTALAVANKASQSFDYLEGG